jgi:uncharacterized SAM-binding protein YcdF (DUF218 family)
VVSATLKTFLVPGSIPFFLIALMPAVLLLFRRKDGGRAGRICVTALVLLYWILSTPMAAAAIVKILSPDVPPVMSNADAGGASAIVLLSAGMEVHRSRDASYGAPTREGTLRVLEAVRVHRLLGGVPIIVTGAHGTSQYSEAGLMAHQLEQLGVPRNRIIVEEKSRNTRDHALLVPPLLKQHGIERFVLVTSQQHIGRALDAFRAVGANPVPSTPEVCAGCGEMFQMYLPSRTGLRVSEGLIYDLLGYLYYKARGWV